MQRQLGDEVLGEDVAGRLASGRSILIFTSSRPGRRIAGSIMSSVGGADHEHVLQRLDAVDLAQQLRDDGVLDIGGTPEPRVRNSESISSKNTITGVPWLAFSRARWNTSRMWRSVSPTYLLSSSGPLMLRKYDFLLLARLGRDLLGQRVGDRLGDEGLAAARRTVEQDALRRLQLVLEEQPGWRYGSSTASRIASIWLTRPPIDPYSMSGTSSRISSSTSDLGTRS